MATEAGEPIGAGRGVYEPSDFLYENFSSAKDMETPLLRFLFKHRASPTP